jgi:long-chain acyl-CoA synthetase
MVVGDAKPYVAALVTVDEEAFVAWKKDHAKSETATVADLRDDDDLRATLREAVDDANAAVSQAEAIKRFRVLATDFTESAGEMTPTMKLRRNVVIERFAEDLELLYAPASVREPSRLPD